MLKLKLKFEPLTEKEKEILQEVGADMATVMTYATLLPLKKPIFDRLKKIDEKLGEII